MAEQAISRELPEIEQLRARIRTLEQRLSDQEQLFHNFCDSSPDGLMLTAPDGHILWANASMCRLLGRTEADIIRIGRGRIMDTSDPRLAPALDERNQMGSVQNIELTCVRKDGLKIPVELSSAIFQDKEGNTRTSIILRDITERKQAETALRQSEEKYRTLVDAAPFGIQLTDLEGRIVYSNPAHHKMQGYGPHELTGMHI